MQRQVLQAKEPIHRVVSKGQAHIRQGLKIEDHRPEASMQQKLKALMGNSLQTKQAAHFQNLSKQFTAQLKNDTSVAQLRGITAGVLNVVGENHDESNIRRGKEKRFCYRKANLGRYWQESEFRERNYSVLKDLISDRRGPADPYPLRLEMLKERVVHASELLTTSWHRDVLPPKFGERLKQTEKELRLLLASVQVWKDTALDSENGRGMTQEFKDQCAADYVIVRTLCDAIVNIKQTIIDTKGMRNSQRIPEICKAIGLYSLDYEFGFKEPNNLTGDYKVVSWGRSLEMHRIANLRSDQAGVWKVGDSHAKDMLDEDDRTYNLVTRQEFNQELIEWIQKGGDKEWDEPKEPLSSAPPELRYYMGL